jgi:hypothetical protein
MYYTGLNPLTGEKVYVAKNQHEKRMQRALIQYRDPKNYSLVHEALVKAGRYDLIGFGPKCLIRPPKSTIKPSIDSTQKVRRIAASRSKQKKQAKFSLL